MKATILDSATGVDASVKAHVQEKYGAAALRVTEGETGAACCGTSGCCGATTEAWDPITADLYDEGQTAGIPAEALLASLGCGNPTALAELNAGETVLDLGLWRRRGLPIAGAVVISPAVALAIFLAVKRIYKRKRPAGGARLHELTYAFPSGHATASAAILGTASYVLWREDMLPRDVAIALASAGTLLVGASRIYLDVHWTTDVLGGWSVGGLVAAMSAAVYERVRCDNSPVRSFTRNFT